ncbi:MAG: hypothetical protein ACLTLQ_19480 [[Clostridium] scindens]
MLTQEEKAILDFLIPQFKNGNPMISLQQICKETRIPNYEADLALRHLSDEGIPKYQEISERMFR